MHNYGYCRHFTIQEEELYQSTALWTCVVDFSLAIFKDWVNGYSLNGWTFIAHDYMYVILGETKEQSLSLSLL